MSFEKTINYKQYLHYKKIQKEYQCFYKGINLVQICAIDFIDFLLVNKKPTLKEIVGQLVNRLNVKNLFNSFHNVDTVFTIDVPKRRDHVYLASMMQKSVSNSTLSILTYYKLPYFNLFIFCKYYRSIDKHTKELSIPFLTKIYLSARFVYYRRAINALEENWQKNPFGEKKFIPFNSSAYTEALLTSFFRLKNLKTYHVFHGIFGRYKNKIANDVVNGCNIMAEYILTFGDTAKQDLIRDFGLSGDKIFIVGNPKYPSKRISINLSFRKCLILGGISLYDRDLEQLFPIMDLIAKQQQIEFHLKPHPFSQIQNSDILKKCKNIIVINKNESIKELFESKKYQFAITYNTATYYECMYYGMIPLRWEPNENLDFEGIDDKFSSEETFLSTIKNIRSAGEEKIESCYVELLVKNLGMGINNYEEIINLKEK